MKTNVPAINPICLKEFLTYLNLPTGPLTSSCCPILRSCKYGLILPVFEYGIMLDIELCM